MGNKFTKCLLIIQLYHPNSEGRISKYKGLVTVHPSAHQLHLQPLIYLNHEVLCKGELSSGVEFSFGCSHQAVSLLDHKVLKCFKAKSMNTAVMLYDIRYQ